MHLHGTENDTAAPGRLNLSITPNVRRDAYFLLAIDSVLAGEEMDVRDTGCEWPNDGQDDGILHISGLQPAALAVGSDAFAVGYGTAPDRSLPMGLHGV